MAHVVHDCRHYKASAATTKLPMLRPAGRPRGAGVAVAAIMFCALACRAALAAEAGGAQPWPVPLTLPHALWFQKDFVLEDGTVVLASGHNRQDSVLFDPKRKTFRLLPASVAPTPQGYFAQGSTGGVPVILGGRTTDAAVMIPHGYVFEKATGRFRPTKGKMASAGRGMAALAPLPDGRVLITGGDGKEWRTLDSAEIYDPRTETFAATREPMKMSRRFHASILLTDGTVLILGGRPGGNPDRALDSTEIYDPKTRTFKAGPKMTRGRAFAAVAPLPDGGVLVCGGEGGSGTAEIYDARKGVFEPLPSPGFGGERSRATALPDGRVALICTRDSCDAGGRVVEIFDPATRSFSLAPVLLTTAYGDFFSATVLKDGALLVAGGRGASGTQAEIYHPPSRGRPHKAEPDPFAKWIAMLGSEKYAEREEAVRRLAAMGTAALAVLQQAAKSDDPEVRFRAKQAMELIAQPAAEQDLSVSIRVDQHEVANVRARAPIKDSGGFVQDVLPHLDRYPEATQVEVVVTANGPLPYKVRATIASLIARSKLKLIRLRFAP